MRRLVVSQNISLDGSIEFLSGWSDGTEADEELAEMTREHSALGDALLVGRKTYVDMRSYWSRQVDDTTGVTEHLNRVTKYVVSRTMTDPGWQNAVILGDGWLDDVRQLKATDGEEIVLTGSISLCHTVIGAGLVDEYRLVLYPAVQGRGRRLFPEGFETTTLRCLENRRFRSGVVLLRYAT